MNFPVATTDQPPVIESAAPSDRVWSRLPKAARVKLAAIRAARDSARQLLDAQMEVVRNLKAPDSAYADATRELDNLERTQRFVPTRTDDPKVFAKAKGHDAILQDAAKRVAHFKAEIDAAVAVQNERGDRWKHLSRLCTHLDRWLGQSERPLVVMPNDAVLTEGQNPLAELETTRTLVVALTAERKRVEQAAMSMAEVKQRVRRFVEGRGAKVNPTGLVGRNGTINVTYGEDADLLALLCWLEPDRVARRLEKEAEAQLEGRHALSELDQARALRDTADRLLAAERREEALIELLATQGTSVMRQTNADPRAVLGVE